MYKIWRIIVIATMTLLIMLLGGCKDEVVLPPPPNSSSQPKPEPERIIADVYWDATVSMQGFTKLASGNTFRSLPDTLGELGGALGEVHFFRFGEQVTPVEGRDHRQFSNPECYTEARTSFGNVLDVADPNHLSIVVTDLFESDADWSNVTQKIREKFLSQHLAVAIIGIKNSFSGDIFDVGLNAAAFSYDSGGNPELYRPFYLFLVGEEPQVRAFINLWKTKMTATDEIKYVMFSECFGEYIADVDSKHSVKKNMFEDRRLKKTDKSLREAGISDRKKDAEITIPGKFQQYKEACALKTDKLEPRIKIFVLNDEEGKYIWKEDESKRQSQDGNGMKVTFTKHAADENGNDCDIKLKIPSSTYLPRGRISLVRASVVPTRESAELPEWISEWDMGDIDVAPEAFDGSKTINLKRIVASLKESLFAASQPVIAEMYIVIDGR